MSNMEEALKARKLVSATSRRQRMQERQMQQQSAHQDRMERKRQVVSEIRALEGSEDDSDASACSDHDHSYSSTSPSESSIRTPDTVAAHNILLSLNSAARTDVSPYKGLKINTKELGSNTSTTNSQPKMQATLTTIEDWNYDRFSVILDPFDLEEQILQGLSEETTYPSSDEDFDEDSPIEVATPILYTMPKMSPRLISITSFNNRTHSPNTSRTDYFQLPARRHVSDQVLPRSTYEATKTGVSKVFQMSNTSSETVESSSNSSQISRSVSLASHSESVLSNSISCSSHSDTSGRSPKRKSSLPLLFGNNKTGHSRMSSIKKLIRSSTLGPSSSGPVHASLQRQPSNATLETHFESRSSSVDIARSPTMEKLQQSSHIAMAPSPALSNAQDLIALPSTRFVPIPPEAGTRLPTTHSNTFPKPMSKLRSRSGSIGQALKSVSTGPKKTDPSAPPLPNIIIPPISLNVDMAAGDSSSPPPLTPKNPRRSMATYSMFPVADKKSPTASVGLGLRY